MTSHIPAYYYPTTVVFVDDKPDFLTNFSLQLDRKIASQLFTSTSNAIAHIKKATNSNHISQRSFSIAEETEGNPITNQTVTFNLSVIQEEIYNPKRFSEVSVVVVDYDMPSMNGLEFLEKLGNCPLKKILLTGKADEKIAVKAFNEGLINHFIQKSDRDVLQTVETKIFELQEQYFSDMSEDMLTLLARNSPSFVTDPIFADFFHQLCKKHHIVEYYLIELTGSFLLLDVFGNASLLTIKCYEDLNIHYEFAVDNGAPQEVLDEIRSGNKIPFAWHADDYFAVKEPEDWVNQLRHAEEIKGKEIYYYAFVKNPNDAPISPGRIYSYSQYLTNLRDTQEIL